MKSHRSSKTAPRRWHSIKNWKPTLRNWSPISKTSCTRGKCPRKSWKATSKEKEAVGAVEEAWPTSCRTYFQASRRPQCLNSCHPLSRPPCLTKANRSCKPKNQSSVLSKGESSPLTSPRTHSRVPSTRSSSNHPSSPSHFHRIRLPGKCSRVSSSRSDCHRSELFAELGYYILNTLCLSLNLHEGGNMAGNCHGRSRRQAIRISQCF